ncbi:MAG: hypothetical protein AABX77_03210 [Nanoarchaeota archaeon]
MAISLKKRESLEERINKAAKSIVDQFEQMSDKLKDAKLPNEILLRNYRGLEIFKQILEKKLESGGYKIPVILDSSSEKESYFIDVISYMSQENYP